MPVNIIIFGRLTDIAGSLLSLENVRDTNALVKELHSLYPALADTKYVMAVNKMVVHENMMLTENSTVALLPPFSGG
jgi:molybdopterin converting factor small subunit